MMFSLVTVHAQLTSTMPSSLWSKRGGDESDDGHSLGTNPVVVCVDRSITSQLEMNYA